MKARTVRSGERGGGLATYTTPDLSYYYYWEGGRERVVRVR